MKVKRKYTINTSPKELYFMHGVWKNSVYSPGDFAFELRAIFLARIECKIHHLEMEDES